MRRRCQRRRGPASPAQVPRRDVHEQLRDLLDASSNASDISLSSQQRTVAVGRRGLTFFCPDAAWQGFMDVLSRNGRRSFAGLLSATPCAAEVFLQRLVGGGGLTVFCPEDEAVAAFRPMFRSLAAGGRAAVLLYHGAPACYGRERLEGFDWVSVRTLASKSEALGVCFDEEVRTLEVWPSAPSCPNGKALVTEEEAPAPLALYVVDAVLLPGELVCVVGRLGWLRCFLSLEVPLWTLPVAEVVGGVAALLGFLVGEFLFPID